MNMAKITLHPNDVAQILKNHAEVELEILGKATEQVAEAIARRVTNEQVMAHVDACIESLVATRTGFDKRKLLPPYEALIHQMARDAVQQAFGVKVTMQAQQMIAKEVKEQMPMIMQMITNELKQNLGSLMKEQLVELLLTKK
jgi:hypothetical protein